MVALNCLQKAFASIGGAALVLQAGHGAGIQSNPSAETFFRKNLSNYIYLILP